jgi:hypothetical protein
MLMKRECFSHGIAYVYVHIRTFMQDNTCSVQFNILKLTSIWPQENCQGLAIFYNIYEIPLCRMSHKIYPIKKASLWIMLRASVSFISNTITLYSKQSTQCWQLLHSFFARGINLLAFMWSFSLYQFMSISLHNVRYSHSDTITAVFLLQGLPVYVLYFWKCKLCQCILE